VQLVRQDRQVVLLVQQVLLALQVRRVELDQQVFVVWMAQLDQLVLLHQFQVQQVRKV
jgi:hypothetical protein